MSGWHFPRTRPIHQTGLIVFSHLSRSRAAPSLGGSRISQCVLRKTPVLRHRQLLAHHTLQAKIGLADQPQVRQKCVLGESA